MRSILPGVRGGGGGSEGGGGVGPMTFYLTTGCANISSDISASKQPAVAEARSLINCKINRSYYKRCERRPGARHNAVNSESKGRKLSVKSNETFMTVASV